MRFRFFTIPVSGNDALNDELNRFCAQHRVIQVDKEFVMNAENSFWAICISWQEGEAGLSTSKADRTPTVDYKEILSEQDFRTYLELRAFRKALAERNGVPPYALFTNQQLADMIQQRVSSKAGLQAINGVGKSRMDNYGNEFLQRLAELREDGSKKPDNEANDN